jgi:predicted alpha/beta superfamily hydrolase
MNQRHFSKRMTDFYRTLLLAMGILVGSSMVMAAEPATQPVDDGQPVVIANARQFDLTSKINTQTYRLFVYTSAKLDLTKPQPVVYVLDGSYYFGAACDEMAVNKLAGIVVGVGYPLDDRDEIVKRRSFDLSLPNASGSSKNGGADAFLRVLTQEIKPFINTHYKIDPARQALFGHSLGGLTTLHEMFTHPEEFSTYLITSPSIWWNSKAVLHDEEAFAKKARAGELHLKILITSATDEQYHGDNTKRLAAAQKDGMIDNATALAKRLAALDPKDVEVTRQLINDETHVSGSIPSVCRGLRFALGGGE